MTKKLSERVRTGYREPFLPDYSKGADRCDEKVWYVGDHTLKVWADEIESLERQRDALLDAGKYLIETMNAGDGLGEAIDMIEAAIKSVEDSHE